MTNYLSKATTRMSSFGLSTCSCRLQRVVTQKYNEITHTLSQDCTKIFKMVYTRKTIGIFDKTSNRNHTIFKCCEKEEYVAESIKPGCAQAQELDDPIAIFLNKFYFAIKLFQSLVRTTVQLLRMQFNVNIFCLNDYWRTLTKLSPTIHELHGSHLVGFQTPRV